MARASLQGKFIAQCRIRFAESHGRVLWSISLEWALRLGKATPDNYLKSGASRSGEIVPRFDVMPFRL